MLIDIEEVKTMIEKNLPSIAAKHPGVKTLIAFIGKTVNAINSLDQRLSALESRQRDNHPD